MMIRECDICELQKKIKWRIHLADGCLDICSIKCAKKGYTRKFKDDLERMYVN